MAMDEERKPQPKEGGGTPARNYEPRSENFRLRGGHGANQEDVVYFWSDSFVRSFVKQNNNSVWISTVTISPPADKISTGK